jgi:hypothetical protein
MDQRCLQKAVAVNWLARTVVMIMAAAGYDTACGTGGGFESQPLSGVGYIELHEQ